MKKLYVFFFAVLICGSTIAQPTLTAANVNPVIGQTYEKKLFTPGTNQQGGSGANQIWNWSGAVEQFSGSGAFVNPTGTPYYSSYPTATACFEATDGSYEYLLGNTTGLFRLGFQNPGAGISHIFTNSAQLLKYSMTMGTTFSDTYASDVVVPTDAGTMSGSVTVTADAWGTLITPAGTFTNVLRVHAHYDEVYDYDIFGSIPQIYDQYSYWKADVHFPLAEYTNGLSGGDPFSSASWVVSTVGINEVSAEIYNLSVYPNPANTSTEVAFQLSEASEVFIEIRDLTSRVVRKSGVSKMNPGNHAVRFDVSDLSAGIYVVAATFGNQTASMKMVVQH